MNETVCNDNRFNLIAKYKAKLIEATNIETSQDEMAVIDNILFRMWQMGWLDKLDAASPWHRVEDPPEEHGKYPVCWVENGNFYWQEAHYCYYQDGDKWVAWSSYQGDDVEITPDYWMPIEPPKEDA
jgi:hypothetical protein